MSWIQHPATGIFLVLGGVAMLGTTVWIGVETQRFVSAAQTAPGTIVALQRERGIRGSTRDHPVVEYHDPSAGSTRRFKSRFGIWPSPFRVGEPVEVLIRQAPPRVEIDSFWTLWFLPLVLFAFGSACMFAGRSILLTRGES